jgi:RsiW-degrading membrane proteinase PrsW (M82 family)
LRRAGRRVATLRGVVAALRGVVATRRAHRKKGEPISVLVAAIVVGALLGFASALALVEWLRS